MEDSEDTATDPGPGSRRRLWPAIAAVLVLTLLAIWLVPENSDEPQTPPLPTLPKPAAPAASVEPPAAPPAPAQPPEADGDYARTFIERQQAATTPDPAAAYAEAERLRSEGRLTDAWLIHFYAARLGHAPSALVLGTLSDPTYHEAGMGALDAPDPAQALKWYKVAADAGDGEAARRLDNLRTRLEQAAAEGDPEAQRLLLQFR
ncbi:MAG: deoxyribonuclease [Gammaproteobacteria bacterium]